MFAKNKNRKKLQGYGFMVLNNRGIALAMVLVLSLITLMIMSTLLFMILQGTKFSGFFKRYATEREAGIGGAEIIGALITDRGLNQTGLTLSSYSTCSSPPCNNSTFASCDCGDPDDFTDTSPNTCFCRKMCDPTSAWSTTCNYAFDTKTDYDMSLSLQADPLDLTKVYQVFAKIVDTTTGNSDLSGEELGGTSVTASNSGIINAPPLPYMYRIEVNAENPDLTVSTDKYESSRLSVLYAY